MDNDREIFGRLNQLENQVAEMRGEMAVLAKAIPRAITILGVVVLVELAVIIYGAVGERGLRAVRETVPINVSCIDIMSPSESMRIWGGRDEA